MIFTRRLLRPTQPHLVLLICSPLSSGFATHIKPASKDHKSDLAVGHLGADLLITAQWSTLEFGNFKAKLLLQNLAGCPCRIYLVVSQEHSIVFCPLHQLALLVVIRDNS